MLQKDESRQLDERPQEILRLIVRSYITNGEPIGSRTLSKIIDARLSPATIRNIIPCSLLRDWFVPRNTSGIVHVYMP